MAQSSHVRRVAEPIDELVTEVVTARLARADVAGLLAPPPVDTAPLRDRLDVLRVRADKIAAMLGDPDSGMTAAQFTEANRRVQASIRDIEAELGRHRTGSALAGIADAPDPAGAFCAASIDRRRAIVDMLMTVTLRRGTRGRNASGDYFDPDSVDIAWK